MFVALDLPEPARAALAGWRDALVAGRSDLRPVAPEALHVTLAFLGWQPEREAERIAETGFAGIAGVSAPRLACGAVRPLPPRAPRLFALDLADEEGRATALQAGLSDALEAARFYRPEKRPFWPHLTLARVKRGARAEPLPDLAPPTEPFEATRLTLYRSTLRPQGALYEPLARTELR
jgi:RNA 2',3'-cyclic 3'-phosphodiesterase